MDGWITIGTQLETDKFDRQVADLENQIKREEEKQQLNIDANSKLNEEYAQATREVEELTKQYNQAANEAGRLQRIVSQRNAPIISQERLDYDEQVRKLDELNAKLEEASTKQSKLGEKVAKSNLEYQGSVNKVTKLNAKIGELNAKKEQLQFKEAEKSINNVQKGITGAIGKIGKMAAAVLGVRSAFMLLRQASSTLAQYNKQYATDLEYMRFVLAQGLAPVLEKIVALAQTLMAYINYLSQRLFGVNLFAQGSAAAFKQAKDNMNGMAKSSKEIKNNLAGFDELNVLDSSDVDAAGGGALAPSLDIGGLQDVEIPSWLEKLADLLEPVVNFFKDINDKYGPVVTAITAVVAALAGFWILKGLASLFTGFSKGIVGLSADFTGFFDALGRAAEAIAILGGLALVINSITNLIDTFSKSGMTLGQVAGLLGIVLGELAVAFIGLLAAMTLLKPRLDISCCRCGNTRWISFSNLCCNEPN